MPPNSYGQQPPLCDRCNTRKPSVRFDALLKRMLCGDCWMATVPPVPPPPYPENKQRSKS